MKSFIFFLIVITGIVCVLSNKPGEPVSIPIDDPELVQELNIVKPQICDFFKYNDLSIRILEATRQLVAGYLFCVFVVVRRNNSPNDIPQQCNAEIWFKPWKNFTKLVSFECNYRLNVNVN